MIIDVCDIFMKMAGPIQWRRSLKVAKDLSGFHERTYGWLSLSIVDNCHETISVTVGFKLHETETKKSQVKVRRL